MILMITGRKNWRYVPDNICARNIDIDTVCMFRSEGDFLRVQLRSVSVCGLDDFCVQRLTLVRRWILCL